MTRALSLLLLAACSSTVPSLDTDTGLDTEADTELGTEADTDADTVSQHVCDYFQAGESMVWCDGDTPQQLAMITTGEDDPECPTYYTLDGSTGDSPESVLAASDCDDSCVYVPYQAVMVLHCDTRGEYISYLPGGAGQDGDGEACPGLIQAMTLAGNGWYETWEDFTADNPCPGNSAPVLADLETTALSWSIGGGAVMLSDALTVSDANDTELEWATVRIASGFAPGFDGLALTSRPIGISPSWDSRTGTLTLSGTASLATYQSALRTVAFDATAGEGFSGADRVLAVSVHDGDVQSNELTRTVTVSAR